MAAAAPTFSARGTPSFCDPAKLRILLVPAGPIEHAEFERWASFVRGITRVRLKDVPRASSSLPPLSPLALLGEVHVQCVTAYDKSHAFLAPFSVHTQVLGVLGLATYTRGTPQSRDMERVPGLLRAQHPGALVHRVFGIEARRTAADGDGDLGGGSVAEADDEFLPIPGFSGRKESGLVVFPAQRRDAKDVRFYVRTLVAELVGEILDALDTLVSSLDGMPLETPRETLSGLVGMRAHEPRTPTTPRAEAPPQSSVAKVLGSRIIRRRESTGPERPASGPTSATRFAKVRADAALLAGDLWTAIETYDSILTVPGRERALAGGQDAVWFASALEGWAVTRTLLARLGGAVVDQAPRSAYPFGPGRERDRDARDSTPPSLVWKDIAEAYVLALSIYAKCLAPPQLLAAPLRSVTSETPRDYTHPLLHAGACLAYARFLHAIWASSGWNGECFDQLLAGGMPPALGGGTPSPAEYAQFSALSGVYRHEVAAAADAAVTQSLRVLSAADQLAVLGEVAAVLAQLGFARRHAHVVVQLHAVLARVLSHSFGARADMPIDLGVPARLVPAGTHDSSPALALAMQAADTYGVNLLSTPVCGLPPTHALAKARARVINARYAPLIAGDVRAELARLETHDPRVAPRFGWPALQVHLVKALAALAEALSDHVTMVFFGALLLRNYAPVLGAHEQAALYAGLHAVLPAARASAPALALAYYGPPDLVAALEVRPPPGSRVPCARTRTEFAHGMYARRTPTDCELVHGEPLVVDTTLQNPLDIELHITRAELCVAGVAFEPAPASAVVPARSMHTLCLHGVPRGSGTLRITGVSVTLWGAAPHTLHIAAPPPPGERVRIRDAEHPVGLDARPALRAVVRAADDAQPHALECTVHPPQPAVQMALPDLVRPALELSQGSSVPLAVRLTNTSDIPADLVRIDLDDSLCAPAHDAIGSGTLLPGDAHELEWQLVHRPVLARDDAARVSIAPRSSLSVPVRVAGRAGCTWARITVHYAHDAGDTHVLAKATQRTFALTVHPSVTCTHAAVLAPSHSASARLGAHGPVLALAFENHAADAREVVVTSGTAAHPAALAAHDTVRVLVPIAPVALDAAALAREIPSVLPKQYVVPRTRLSAEVHAEKLRQFWVRSAILKHVSAAWHAPGGGGGGDVSLRGMWPTPAECDTVLVPRIGVSLAAGDAVAEQPTAVTATVTNTTDTPLTLVCTWALVHPAARVLVTDGTWTSRVAPWPLAPRATTTATKTLCFLAHGMYTLQATVASVHADVPQSTSAPLHIHVSAPI